MKGAGVTKGRSNRPARLSRAKVSPPLIGRTLVTRDRLLDLLDAASRVTVLIAGAGSGKTSLLAQWARSREGVAWLSADEGDVDPVRFVQGLVAAIGRVAPGFGGAVTDLLVLDGAVTLDALEEFSDDAALLDPPVSLVIDDFHRAGADTAQVLRTLLERCSDALRFIISSRTDLPVGTERLAAAGVATTIRSRDLQLSRAEVNALIGSLDVDLAPEEVNVVLELTDGWVAGVQLSALALRDADQRDDVLRRLGAPNAVVEYLWSEVLDVQPDEVRRFLLDTCIVEELTPELALALCPGSPVSLRQLEAAGLPVAVLGTPGRSTYRYHQLFSDALRRRLHDHEPAHEIDLHRRAAEWFRAHEDLPRAFWHGWRGGLRQEAMTNLHDGLFTAYYAGELALLTADGVSFTDSDIALAPGAALAATLALVLAGRTAEAFRLLERIEAIRSDSLTDPERLELGAMRVTAAMLGSDMEKAIEHGLSTLVFADDAGLVGEWRDLVASLTARGYSWMGDTAAADRVAAGVPLAGASLVRQVEHRGALAQIDLLAGRLTGSIEHSRRALEQVHGTVAAEGGELPIWAVLGCALLERNELVEAERLLQRVRDHDTGRHVSVALANVALSRLLRSRGEVDAALVVAEDTRRLFGAPAPGNPIAAHAWSQFGRILADSGNLTDARGVVDALPEGADRRVLEARCELLAGRLGGAQAALERLSFATLDRRAVEAAVLRVGVALAAGESVDHSVDLAIAIAEQECFVFALAECGASTLIAIQERARRLPQTDFIEQVLRLPPHATLTNPDVRYSADMLTERERVVLRYLATSLSYPEIASALYVSLNTVKTHSKNVIRKLHATSRRDAVAVARALHYL